MPRASQELASSDQAGGGADQGPRLASLVEEHGARGFAHAEVEIVAAVAVDVAEGEAGTLLRDAAAWRLAGEVVEGFFDVLGDFHGVGGGELGGELRGGFAAGRLLNWL